MDFFDRGPPPPHYLSWWKPPSSYFPPPRGEAPPPYEEAIVSTSHCLPPTFTSVYNNNNVATTAINEPSQAQAPTTQIISEVAEGQGPANVSEKDNPGNTTVTPAAQENPGQAEAGNSRSQRPSSSSHFLLFPGFPASSNSNLVSCSEGRPKRYHSVGNTSSTGHTHHTGRNETEHLRRNLIQLPLASTSTGSSCSGSVLLPFPPPYQDHDPYDFLRHHGHQGTSATLPRHGTAELHRHRPAQLSLGGGVDKVQQRLSLQLNVGVGGSGDWSSGSSSCTFSAPSTPNSPHLHAGGGGGGRPPSLSSSSSSNLSANNVRL